MATGYWWTSDGKTRRVTRVHAAQRGMVTNPPGLRLGQMLPLCGAHVSPSATFQQVDAGFLLYVIDCRACRRLGTAGKSESERPLTRAGGSPPSTE